MIIKKTNKELGGVMEYKTGNIGRIIIVRFEDKEDVLEGLINIAKEEDIRAGIVYIIGGMRKGDIVVGPQKDEIPPEPIWHELKESHEALGIGTIFWQDDEPKVHLHGAFGKRDNVRVGCLRKDSETFLVLEAVIMEIKDVNAIRELDPISGLSLLRLQ